MVTKHVYILILALGCLSLSCSDDNGTNPVQPTPPEITINDHTVVEGTTALISVTLNKAATSNVIFQFTTANISAVAGSDYTEAVGTDTIGAGSDEVFILVGTTDDGEVEDTETFSVVLTSVSGATVARSLATCTITDNDDASISFSANVRPILLANCANVACHGGSLPGGGMYISTAVTYDDVINATGTNTASLPNSSDGKIVQPGHSEYSTLFTKIDTVAGPVFPSLMPSGGRSPLSRAQQLTIRDWIDQGAQNN